MYIILSVYFTEILLLVCCFICKTFLEQIPLELNDSWKTTDLNIQNKAGCFSTLVKTQLLFNSILIPQGQSSAVQAKMKKLITLDNLYLWNNLIQIVKCCMYGLDAVHPSRPNTSLHFVISFIMATICAGSSIRTGPEQRAGSPVACNPIQGHEMLTSDPTCDTSGNVVPQVSGKCAKQSNKIPVLQHSRAPVVCWSWSG